MSNRPIYVLGTGTSHDGSACLLKDGKIKVAIEKERVTRIKHDGFNDTAAIQYCLDAEGITMDEITLVVQNDNFGNFKYGNEMHFGKRLVKDNANYPVVTISHHLAHAYSAIGTCPFDEFNILVLDGCGSPYDQCIDLVGGIVPGQQKMDVLPHLYFEKDSFYHYQDEVNQTIFKDFSPWAPIHKYPMYPYTTQHSIGGLYEAASIYCVEGMADPGKLMGLAPYGKEGFFQESVFDMEDGRVYLNYDWMERYQDPTDNQDGLKRRFEYYANIAYGIQKEIERAILYLVRHRLALHPCENLCYAGGTALNAVANSRILKETDVNNLYIEPAAGDNGLALGCAYYGWLEVLKKERVKHPGTTCFGMEYPAEVIERAIKNHTVDVPPMVIKERADAFFNLLDRTRVNKSGRTGVIQFNIEDTGVYQVVARLDGQLRSINGVVEKPTSKVVMNSEDFHKLTLQPGQFKAYVKAGKIRVSHEADLIILWENYDFEEVVAGLPAVGEGNVVYRKSDRIFEDTAALLAAGKIIGWFQEGSEFGPRALGHRSILADPRKEGARDFINAKVKFREDFRPFAPSVLVEDVSLYFDKIGESPYMILVDPVKPEWKDKIGNVVHVNDSCRIQTVAPSWNYRYYQLLQAFKSQTGISVLLNTSFNRKGMPIVETPSQALEFFFECQLDYLVMGDFIVSKLEGESNRLSESKKIAEALNG